MAKLGQEGHRNPFLGEEHLRMPGTAYQTCEESRPLTKDQSTSADDCRMTTEDPTKNLREAGVADLGSLVVAGDCIQAVAEVLVAAGPGRAEGPQTVQGMELVHGFQGMETV